MNKFLIFFICCFFPVAKSCAYQYEVSACCIFQNEARFLKEWIDYHLLIGVEHFYVYDNLSEDNALDVLAPYIETGTVDYIFWDRTYDSPGGWWYVQRDAYMDAMHRAMGQSKWLCVIDTDEFIVPIKDENLKVFLRDYEDYGGVCLNWVFYGTSGVKRIPNGQWMITCLLQRARLSYPQHRTIKTIAQPERVDVINSFFPHICAYRPPFYYVDPNKKKIVNKESIELCIDRIRLHHYWSRDLDFLLMEKFPRNERWYGTEVALKKIDEEKVMNDEYDPIILDVINRLKGGLK